MNFFKFHLLFIVMLTFVSVASFAVSIGRIDDSKNNSYALGSTSSDLTASAVKKYFPKRPQLKDDINTFPVFSSQAVLVQDVDSGVTLYEKNPDSPVLPASTTKIITSLVSMDYYQLDTILTIPRLSVEGQKMGLVPGEKMSVRDLLYGLLVYSANDAAEALAYNYCVTGISGGNNCGREFFVQAMNQKARDLGLTNTRFANPTGLDTDYHFSTARDLVIMSEEAMKNPFFAQIVGTKETIVKGTESPTFGGKNIVHKLTNINELLGTVDGVLGVKTGWTEGARENLVTYLERDGKRVMIALLGSQDRFGETRELINWIFGSYDWQEVVYSYNGI